VIGTVNINTAIFSLQIGLSPLIFRLVMDYIFTLYNKSVATHSLWRPSKEVSCWLPIAISLKLLHE